MPLGKKYGGRKKGTPNKLSMSVKQSLESVYNQLGGDEALLKWARRNRTRYYLLWAKMLPKDMNVKMDLDDTLGKEIRNKLDAVDGPTPGQSSETRSPDPSSVGDAASPPANQSAPPEDGSGQAG